MFKNEILKLLQNKKKLDDETTKVLKLALKNTKIYCRKVYNNIDDLEKAINDSNTNYISVSFPKTTMIKTKKGGHDFALNLQSIMAKHQILITAALLRKPNDSNILNDVLQELKLNFEILKELAIKRWKI